MAGSIHARSARLAGAELAGVSASSPATAEAAAERLGASRAFADARALIEQPEIDVVHICTPNDLHFELASAAIAAGKHVVCEKPLAIELSAANALETAAATAGTIAAVPFVYRFYPMVREARALVELERVGRIGLIRGAYLQDWLLPRDSSNWRVDVARGGPSRAFADIGSHWCDLVEFVTAQRITAVSAQTRTLRPKRPPAADGMPSFSHRGAAADAAWQPVETEDVAVVSFQTAADAAGSVVVSQVSAGHKNRLSFELTGSGGTLRFDQQAPDSLLLGREDTLAVLERDPERLQPAAQPYATLPAGHPQGYHDCFDAFVRDVYDSIIAGRPVEGLPTFGDGVRAVALTEAVLSSAANGAGWIEVDRLSGLGTFAEKQTKLA